jgi:FtsZ-binding cell division protein ZapB
MIRSFDLLYSLKRLARFPYFTNFPLILIGTGLTTHDARYRFLDIQINNAMKTKLSTKKIRLFILFLALSPVPLALCQIPQGFNYQAIARTSSGLPITNQTIPVRISIVTALTGGTVIWQEEQASVTANQNGLISLVVGTGTQTGGTAASFSAIDWSAQTLYLKTEVKYQSTTWTDMGTSQIWAVPYSLLAKNIAPLSKLGITGSTDNMDEALFEVKNKTGNSVFAVYNEGIRANVGNGDAKGSKGGFAVGGYDATKGVHNLLTVNSDSVRVYVDTNPSTKGAKGGFAVGGYDMTKGTTSNFFNVSIDSNGVVNPAQNRILWYPLKNAFLTGKVLIESPDSVGINSFSSGFKSIAKGNWSQALGFKAVARGAYSTAIGNNAAASKTNSFAFGENAEARNEESYALGRGAIAEGWRSFAFGSAGIDSAGQTTGVAYAKGDYSFAIGQGSQAFGRGSFAIGLADSAIGEYSLAMGYKTKSMGWTTTAMGSHTTASGGTSTAMGWGTIADGPSATAMGAYTYSLGENTTSMGLFTTARGFTSTVMGYRSVATGWVSTAMGHGSKASGYASTSMGDSTLASGSASTAMGSYTIATGPSSTAMGYSSDASGNSSTAMGANTKAIGSSSTAMGYNTNAGGENSTSMGNSTIATGSSSAAMGYLSNASGENSTSMGTATVASGSASIAMGNGSAASGWSSFASGGSTKATGGTSTAMGWGTIASGASATALGAITKASGDNSASMGLYTIAKPFLSLAIGLYNDSTCSSSSSWIPSDPIFIIGNGTADNNRLNAFTVLKNGYTAIGHASPTQMLDVNGNARFRGVSSGTFGNNLNIMADGTLTTATSDVSMKENIYQISNALDLVTQLRGVFFNWKNDAKKTQQIGMIAQEVEPVVPAIVFTNPVDGLKGINYSQTTALLVEAIKDQQHQIESQKRENQQLKADLQAMKERLDRMEGMMAGK